jgi:heptaprenyl diphosphate synthase
LLAAASAIELARASAGLIRQLVDHPRGDPARLNNGLCVLIADFAVSRSAHQAVRAGIAFTRELSATMKKTLVAQFGECQQAFTPNRTVENYLGMARARTSGPLALAARFATSLDGAGTDLARRVDGFCRALGVAVQISTDLEDLLANNHHSSRRSTGTDLRLGVHALPVIYAAKRDRRLRRLLCHPVEERDMPRIIQTLYDTGGMAKTLELATESTDNALAVLRGRGGTSVDGLEALAALTAEHTHAMIG